jgi:hypothetical protein
MSKKKNTLKDLDEFLKQQAASLVSPDKLGQKTEEPQQQVTSESNQPVVEEKITPEKILSDLKSLAKSEGPAFQKNLYDLIIKSLETHDHSTPEDKMLINTALYLKSGDNWKEAIRSYWKDHH